MDKRHPAKLAHQLTKILPNAALTLNRLTEEILTVGDFTDAFAPEIRNFIKNVTTKQTR